MKAVSITMVAFAALAAAGAVAASNARPSEPPQAAAAVAVAVTAEAGRSLGALINARLREGGSFFTPEERARIEAMCGYRPGEWDGFEVNDVGGAFHCTNGRTVDSREMRAILRAAAPRIEARVHGVVASAEIKAAIQRVASEATARALAEVGRPGSRGER